MKVSILFAVRANFWGVLYATFYTHAFQRWVECDSSDDVIGAHDVIRHAHTTVGNNVMMYSLSRLWGSVAFVTNCRKFERTLVDQCSIGTNHAKFNEILSRVIIWPNVLFIRAPPYGSMTRSAEGCDRRERLTEWLIDCSSLPLNRTEHVTSLERYTPLSTRKCKRIVSSHMTAIQVCSVTMGTTCNGSI
jgi:hypothetical protein